MKNFVLGLLLAFPASQLFAQDHGAWSTTPDSIGGHPVVVDGDGRLDSWLGPPNVAYDHVLHARWNFIKTKVPQSPGPRPRSNYPQYYFYCAFRDSSGVLLPDQWMNDVGEKIPNWFESARLYFAYSGDSSVMEIVQKMIDYSLEHGISPSTFDWPNFPYTTTNAGDIEFRGFNAAKRFALHEIQVDHAAEMGLTYFRMYQYSGDLKYLNASLNIADVLARKVRTGSASQSPWPYRVIMETGKVTSEYGANWTGAWLLFDYLIRSRQPNTNAYSTAQKKVKDFLLQHPLVTGYWTDGHSDTEVNANTYRSNLSNSNFTLCLFDHPELDPQWKKHVPELIQWTEKYFVFRTSKNEPATQWGAHLVGEQDDFNFKMDYQTARYAAECARWYAISGDTLYKEKALRSMNWVTYCMNEQGKVFESPVSKGILSWWSDSYGEGPRMFYPALAAIPEWAPRHQDHILYSDGILRKVVYGHHQLSYTAASLQGKEIIKLSFRPKAILLNGKRLSPEGANRYALRPMDDGDYVISISRTEKGIISITGS